MKNKVFKIAFRIVGIVIFLIGIRMIGEGVWNYVSEHQQGDWITTYAEVIDISSEYSQSSIKRPSRVEYDITYQYEVDGIKYSDELYNRKMPMALGEKIKIKYDPDEPKNSTDILFPSFGNLVVFLILGVIFGTAGFFISGSYLLIRKIQGKELSPSDKCDNVKARKTKKPSIEIIIKRFIIQAVVIAGIFLSIKLFPGTQPVGINEFKEAAATVGFTTTSTTDRLRQEWKVGSMMKESCSFDNGNIRIDFCVMDTADSAIVLYNGMVLPISDGDVKDIDGMVQEIHSVENDSQFAGKLRIRDTVIYVTALSDEKDKAVDLLKAIGYWKE